MTPSLATVAAPAPTRPTTPRTVGRWMISFVGFPLGGFAAMVSVGPVDSTWRAVVGALATGLVLGAVQAWALRADRQFLLAWTVATSVGLAVGLGIGASIVDFGTGLGDLVRQGAASGLAVGAAQALALLRRTGPVALLWPVWLAAIWAIGWTVTAAIDVEVEAQFTVFGSAGAITAALLTTVLPVSLAHQARKGSRP